MQWGRPEVCDHPAALRRNFSQGEAASQAETTRPGVKPGSVSSKWSCKPRLRVAALSACSRSGADLASNAPAGAVPSLVWPATGAVFSGARAAAHTSGLGITGCLGSSGRTKSRLPVPSTSAQPLVVFNLWW